MYLRDNELDIDTIKQLSELFVRCGQNTSVELNTQKCLLSHIRRFELASIFHKLPNIERFIHNKKNICEFIRSQSSNIKDREIYLDLFPRVSPYILGVVSNYKPFYS